MQVNDLILVAGRGRCAVLAILADCVIVLDRMGRRWMVGGAA